MDLIDNPYNNNLNYDELGFFSTNTTKALTEICSLATETAQELCEYDLQSEPEDVHFAKDKRPPFFFF